MPLGMVAESITANGLADRRIYTKRATNLYSRVQFTNIYAYGLAQRYITGQVHQRRGKNCAALVGTSYYITVIAEVMTTQKLAAHKKMDQGTACANWLVNSKITPLTVSPPCNRGNLSPEKSA